MAAVSSLFSPTAVTVLSDVIVPAVWNPYVIVRTTELSELFTSGIVAPVDGLNVLGMKGGTIVNMPFWNDINQADQVLSDVTPLGVNKISTGQDAAVLQARGNSWGANDLAAKLSGDDPAGAIGSLVASYWSRRMQHMLLSILQGIFSSSTLNSGGTSGTGNLFDISGLGAGANQITPEALIDACQVLGDHEEDIVAMIVHSKTHARLKKMGVIDSVDPQQTGQPYKLYQNKRVLVDDQMPVSGSGANAVYTTYLFGYGAVGYGEGNPKVPTETDRDSLQGDDLLINRRQFILHPRGMAWTPGGGVPAGVAPTNTEMQSGSRWTRVYDYKLIRIVAMNHLN